MSRFGMQTGSNSQDNLCLVRVGLSFLDCRNSNTHLFLFHTLGQFGQPQSAVFVASALYKIHLKKHHRRGKAKVCTRECCPNKSLANVYTTTSRGHHGIVCSSTHDHASNFVARHWFRHFPRTACWILLLVGVWCCCTCPGIHGGAHVIDAPEHVFLFQVSTWIIIDLPG